MTDKSAKQLNPLFDLLERCHTILADIFPHQGLKAIGGSRVFFRDPLVAVLKKCVEEVVVELKKPQVVEAVSSVSTLWVSVADLLKRIERRDLAKESADEINKAATLMYLANGVVWNYLRELVVTEPPHNPQYVKVEPLLPLLKRCGWVSEINITPQQVAQRLEIELKNCLH